MKVLNHSGYDRELVTPEGESATAEREVEVVNLEGETVVETRTVPVFHVPDGETVDVPYEWGCRLLEQTVNWAPADDEGQAFVDSFAEPAPETDLDKLKKDELLAVAEGMALPVTDAMTKAEIRTLIEG